MLKWFCQITQSYLISIRENGSSMRRLSFRLSYLFFLFYILVPTIISCSPENITPSPPTPTAEPTTVVSQISPESIVPTPSPTIEPPPQSLKKLTDPLPDQVVQNGLRADFVHLPLRTLFFWAGMAWDGDKYIWIVNNQLKGISRLGLGEGIEDQFIQFPSDLKQEPTITGLAWDGAHFWMADVANQMIHQVAPETGERLKSFAYDGTPNGLVWGGDDFLWVISMERLAIEKVTLTGKRQLSYNIEGTWPMGLAWDGKYFWYSDGKNGALYILNPATGKIKRLNELEFMTNPGTFNGLVWIDGYLWVVTEDTDQLHRFDVSQLDWEALEAALQ